MKIYTADKETGTFIEEFDSIKKANDAIERYEVEDKKEGIFKPDFYDVVNENHESIMEEIASNTDKMFNDFRKGYKLWARKTKKDIIRKKPPKIQI